MADPADAAEKEIEAALRLSASRRKPNGPLATGKCLSCNSALPKGLRWCDALCRDDWQEEQDKLK